MCVRACVRAYVSACIYARGVMTHRCVTKMTSGKLFIVNFTKPVT